MAIHQKPFMGIRITNQDQQTDRNTVAAMAPPLGALDRFQWTAAPLGSNRISSWNMVHAIGGMRHKRFCRS